MGISMTIFLCDGTPEGIFSGIYDAWSSRIGHKNLRLEIEAELDGPELFCDYQRAETEEEKAKKVVKAICEKIGKEAYRMVYMSALSKKKGRADEIYRFLLLGFSVGKRILEQLSHPYVRPIFERSRRVSRELHHYYGFLRFLELSNGILFSEIRPENDILSLLGEYFADRFPEENWMIYDAGRKKLTIHQKGLDFFLMEQTDMEAVIGRIKEGELSEREENMQSLWKDFVTSVSIEERENEALCRQMLPLRYREFMPEKDEDLKG
jgi:probable DNA metabolism protein